MTNLTEQLLDAFGADSASAELARDYGLDTFCGLSGGQRRRQVLLTQAVLRGALQGIDATFGDDVPYLLLKGQPLQEILFDGRYLRPTGDVDILVLPGDIGAARRRLKQLGYRPKRDEPPRMWVHNQEPFYHRENGVIVELHWSVAEPQMPQPPIGELFETGVAFELDDNLTVDVLRDDWLFFQLVLHFHHHMGFAKGLLDIAAWCDRFGAECDEQELLDRARQMGMFGMVQWPLHTLEQLTGQRPPLFDDSADRFVRIFARRCAAAMRDCLVAPPGSDLEASLVAIMPTLSPTRGVALRAATMAVVDGGGWEKLRAVMRPIFEGPHFLGRALQRWRFGPPRRW